MQSKIDFTKKVNYFPINFTEKLEHRFDDFFPKLVTLKMRPISIWKLSHDHSLI